MSFRWLRATLLLTIGFVIVVTYWKCGTERIGFTLNLISEMASIIVTVAGIDYLVQRNARLKHDRDWAGVSTVCQSRIALLAKQNLSMVSRFLGYGEGTFGIEFKVLGGAGTIPAGEYEFEMLRSARSLSDSDCQDRVKAVADIRQWNDLSNGLNGLCDQIDRLVARYGNVLPSTTMECLLRVEQAASMMRSRHESIGRLAQTNAAAAHEGGITLRRLLVPVIASDVLLIVHGLAELATKNSIGGKA